MKKRLPGAPALIALILLFFPALLFARERSEPISLTILHVNDVHGHVLPYSEPSVNEKTRVSGAARLAAMIGAERAANPDGSLLLSAGDMFQGTAISNEFRGQSVIEIMNALKFDAMAIGNHEFDWGLDTLAQLVSSARFPSLSANIFDSRGESIHGIKPYVLLTRKNLKIAVIGATTVDTVTSTEPSNVAGLIFPDPATILPEIIKKVREEGAKLVILLSHLGLAADRHLAEQVEGIDVIVGGHSHTVLDDPLLVRGTIIVQAGYYGLYLGVLELAVDPSSGKIVRFTDKDELKPVISGLDLPLDANIAQIVDKYDGLIKEKFAAVTGEASVELTRQPYQESVLGDLITDAMREATHTQIAFHNSGGIRDNIPPGKITLETIYAVLPFDNVLAGMDLTGEQLMEILEQNGALEKKILQVSGIEVEYDMSKPPGSRVAKALVGSEPLDRQKVYSVTTNDFVAAGGDKFATFTKGKNITWGDNLRDVFSAYLKKHSPITPRSLNRIKFLN